MSKGKPIRVYDYVNHPYDAVRKALISDGKGIFHNATKVAASRARNLASELHVNFGGFELSADIAIDIKSVSDLEKTAALGLATVIELEWEASKLPQLFPLMKAELSIYPLTSTETQLELFGNYEPPFGFLGSAVDSVVGNRIAEASVHQFIMDVATYLRDDLA
jgi:hypothetical protein